MLYHNRNIEKLIAVSDSVQFAGMMPGKYQGFGGRDVILHDNGRLCLASDSNVMAGSSSNMIKCMNHLASLKILSENELWQVGYFNPLRALNLKPEKFAHFESRLVFDDESNQFNIL